ncbi:hypothetical protein K0U07_00185 [bacterium]|nr:hypothetical protein [bacterium]
MAYVSAQRLRMVPWNDIPTPTATKPEISTPTDPKNPPPPPPVKVEAPPPTSDPKIVLDATPTPAPSSTTPLPQRSIRDMGVYLGEKITLFITIHPILTTIIAVTVVSTAFFLYTKRLKNQFNIEKERLQAEAQTKLTEATEKCTQLQTGLLLLKMENRKLKKQIKDQRPPSAAAAAAEGKGTVSAADIDHAHKQFQTQAWQYIQMYLLLEEMSKQDNRCVDLCTDVALADGDPQDGWESLSHHTTDIREALLHLQRSTTETQEKLFETGLQRLITGQRHLYEILRTAIPQLRHNLIQEIGTSPADVRSAIEEHLLAILKRAQDQIKKDKKQAELYLEEQVAQILHRTYSKLDDGSALLESNLSQVMHNLLDGADFTISVTLEEGGGQADDAFPHFFASDGSSLVTEEGSPPRSRISLSLIHSPRTPPSSRRSSTPTSRLSLDDLVIDEEEDDGGGGAASVQTPLGRNLHDAFIASADNSDEEPELAAEEKQGPASKEQIKKFFSSLVRNKTAVCE